MTIYDIAEEAGVSASTVSRVINNKSGVKAATRKKIQQLLDKYNFAPDETARGLVNQSSKMVGVLVSDIRTLHHSESAYIIERDLVKHGYCCIIFNTGSDEASKAAYIKILATRRVEAAVLIGSTFQNDSVKNAIKEYLPDLPVVMANGTIDLPNVFSVLTDEENGVADCVRLLVSKGKRHLAFINQDRTPSNRLKQKGFLEEIARQGVSSDAVIIQVDDVGSWQESHDVTVKLIREKPEIDGIIYTTDLLAAGGVRALVDLGVKMPKDVAVIGIDNSLYSEISNPKITSLDNKLLDMSMTCSEILLKALRSQKAALKMRLLSSIVERETT